MSRQLLMLLATVLFGGCGRPPSKLPETAGLTVAQDASASRAATLAGTSASKSGDASLAAPKADEAHPPSTTPSPKALRPEFEACADAANDVDVAMRKCIEIEFAFQDARLNAAYAALGKATPADRMTRLRNVQREWIVDRDENCGWRTGEPPEKQHVQLSYCRLDATASRANELESMLRSALTGRPEDATKAAPVEVNAALDKAGRMYVKAGDLRFDFFAPACSAAGTAMLRCSDVALRVSSADGLKETLTAASLYLNTRGTLYRGPLAQRDRRESQSVVVADLDGDGVDDLALWTGMRGGYGGASYDVYLFDSARESYVSSPALSELTVGTDGLFQIVDGRIRTSAKSGCCIHTESVYVVENDLPKLVERTVVDSTDDRASPKRTVSKLVDGRMETAGD